MQMAEDPYAGPAKYTYRMRLFDGLAPRLRDAIADCILGVPDIHVADLGKVCQAHGEDAAIEILERWVATMLRMEAAEQESMMDELAQMLAASLKTALTSRPEPALAQVLEHSTHWGRRRKRRSERR